MTLLREHAAVEADGDNWESRGGSDGDGDEMPVVPVVHGAYLKVRARKRGDLMDR